MPYYVFIYTRSLFISVIFNIGSVCFSLIILVKTHVLIFCDHENISKRVSLSWIQLISTQPEKRSLSDDLFYNILTGIYIESVSNASTLQNFCGSLRALEN